MRRGCIGITDTNPIAPSWPQRQGPWATGFPAAVAAKLERPEQEVVCLAGDGCFQMCMQEFGTAVQYGANIIVIVSNNGVYGTIRMHQQRHYPTVHRAPI